MRTCGACGLPRDLRRRALPLPTLCKPALADAVRARLGVHGRPPGGRPHPGRALVSALVGDPGRLGLVCPCLRQGPRLTGEQMGQAKGVGPRRVALPLGQLASPHEGPASAAARVVRGKGLRDLCDSMIFAATCALSPAPIWAIAAACRATIPDPGRQGLTIVAGSRSSMNGCSPWKSLNASGSTAARIARCRCWAAASRSCVWNMRPR